MISSSRMRGLIVASIAVLVPMSSPVGAGQAASSSLTVHRPTPAQHSAAEPVQLPAPAAVGQASSTETAIQTTLEGGPVSLLVSTSSSVTSVNDDGSYVAQSVIDSVAVTNAPASADIAAWGFGRLQGVSFEQGYAATGVPISGGSRAVDAETLVLDSVAMASVGFPADPVVVGDSWNVNRRIGNEGTVFTVTYQCRLASVVGGTYTVDVSYAENFTAYVDGGVVEGTISGSGTLSGSLANPLVIWGGLNQTIDGVTTVDGTATPMRRDTSVSVTATGG